MDFEKILHVARKNELVKKEPVKCLQTRFKPPTKEQREKDRVLSEGVLKFLAKKEEEEKQRQREAERRKQELLALRAKDPKANRRVQTMLKRTKSANKSVMEDAIDVNNTADTLAGPSQPDEDDYGFVSETSSQLYNKLIQKMYSLPTNDQPKFSPIKKPSSSNLSNTKERVKMALLKQEEEEKLPHRRKRKGKEKRDGEDEDSNLNYSAPDRDLGSTSSDKEKTEPSKIKKQGPPPLDFQALLKIAEQKQHEPIVFEPKVKKTEEPEVLMTKKQKLEFERMQDWKRRREQSGQNHEHVSSQKDEKGVTKKIPKIKSSGLPQKIPKINNNVEESRQNSKISSDTRGKELKTVPGKDGNKFLERAQKFKGQSERPKSSDVDKESKGLNDETARLIRERDEALRILKEKERLIKERDEAVRKLKEKEQLIRERDEAVRKLKLLEKAEKMKDVKIPVKENGSTSALSGDRCQKSSAGLTLKNQSSSTKVSSNVLQNGNKALKSDGINNVTSLTRHNGKEISQRDIRSRDKAVPSKDMKCKIREFPPRDMKPVKQFPPADVRRKPQAVKRRRIESDDEYDSELDDFIDDGDPEVGQEDVSKVISEIFRYDKNRYSKYDEDDECMESNFAQISKEEFFSTKCGILEDLQDIQKEKAILARKKKR